MINSAQIRIVSGLILFAYVLIHFLNHSLGLISLDVLESVGQFLQAFWRFPPVNIILYAALLAHFIAACTKLFQRRTLKMPPREWAQTVLGFSIPFLMAGHILRTRIASLEYGIDDTYTYVLMTTIVSSSYAGWIYATGVVAAWGHGVIGLYMWVRLKSWFNPVHRELGLAFAVLLPCFALGGFLTAGRHLVPLAADADFMNDYNASLNVPDERIWSELARDVDVVRWSLLTIVVLLILARLVRRAMNIRKGEILIDYTDGPTVKQGIGPTLLEMSKIANVPHANVCGGRGRCSTCRVRITYSKLDLSEPEETECSVLKRINAPEDVRLACQIRPQSDIGVVRLLPPDAKATSVHSMARWATGEEKVITVMFADLRDFTKTSENRLPFDVVYLINQFSKAMGEVVEKHGGWIDKFLGDGFMALFGFDDDAQQSSQQAIAAASEMMQVLDDLNARLTNNLDEPLRMGIGIHTGPVILGEMGYGSGRRLTAVGDTVNVANRLENAAKEQKCGLCLSHDTAEYARASIPKQFRRQITVRGKKDELAIYALNAGDRATIEFEQ